MGSTSDPCKSWATVQPVGLANVKIWHKSISRAVKWSVVPQKVEAGPLKCNTLHRMWLKLDLTYFLTAFRVWNFLD